MKANEFQKLILDEVRLVSREVKEVRQTDLPDVHTRIARLEEKLGNLKEEMRSEAKHSAQIYGGVGGAVSTLFMIAVTFFKR